MMNCPGDAAPGPRITLRAARSMSDVSWLLVLDDAAHDMFCRLRLQRIARVRSSRSCLGQ
eukprot:2505143-Amphidinium_carterae.1